MHPQLSLQIWGRVALTPNVSSDGGSPQQGATINLYGLILIGGSRLGFTATQARALATK